MAFVNQIAAPLYETHRHHNFMLPGLYGGPDKCFAMIILEATSISFTRLRWPGGASAQQAVTDHRQVFLNWVNADRYQRDLFKAILDAALHHGWGNGLRTFDILNSVDCFYKILYVTDVWKCGHKRERKQQRIGCREGREDWLEILQQESNSTHCNHVVLVGKEAQQSDVRALFRARRICISRVPFPTWRNKKKLTPALCRLRKRLISS